MGNNIKKNNFILYNEDYYMIEELSDEDVGNVIKSIFKYAIDNEIPQYNKGTGKSVLFKHIQRTIDINNKKYLETCERNRARALKRWKKIICDNQVFTKEEYAKYCSENGLFDEFDSILLDEKKLFDEDKLELLKQQYNCNHVSNETIKNLFQ